MLTKKYKNGCVTLNAKEFPSVAQETIDREVRNFEPIKVAIEKLHEYEQKDIAAESADQKLVDKNDTISIKEIEKIFEDEMNEFKKFISKSAEKDGREITGMLHRKSAFEAFLMKIYEKMED